MLKPLSASVLACALCATMGATVCGQDYGSTGYDPPRLSPYLNLGVTTNGLSNYPTLVRPLIDDQEAIARQSAEIDRLHRQLRGGRDGQKRASNSRDTKGTASSAGRFMNYSHYFVPAARDLEARTSTRAW